MIVYNKYGDDTATAKLQNRRIYVQRSEDGSIKILFRSLQDEEELNNPYWEKVTKGKFKTRITEKRVQISDESVTALMNALCILRHGDKPILFNPQIVNKRTKK